MYIDQFEHRLGNAGYPEADDSISAAQIDQLTGAKNSRWLLEQLPRIIDESDGNVGLLLIDIDGMKRVNDTEGHSAGDELLKQTALNLTGALRKQDPADPSRKGDIVRYAGDEFVAIVRGVSTDHDLETIKLRLEKSLETDDINASIGGVIYTDETPEEFFRKADGAMYEEKVRRKFEAHSTPEQAYALHVIGLLATQNGIDLRDAPIILEALRASEETEEISD